MKQKKIFKCKFHIRTLNFEDNKWAEHNYAEPKKKKRNIKMCFLYAFALFWC